LNFLQRSNGSAQGLLPSGKIFIALDFVEISKLYYFNDKGTLVQEKPELTLIHEIIHTTPLSDPLPVSAPRPSNAQMSAYFDFDGDVVRVQDIVAAEMGYTLNIQKNYYSNVMSDSALFARFDQSISYSEGHSIDVAVYPENDGVGNDSLDLTHSYKPNSVDIIFGLDGDDNLNGGGGSDYLYGGEGNDTFIASSGDDLFHGGGTRNSAGAALALEDDGIDTADYSAATAAEHIKITTDVTLNTAHSAAIDASHRLLVQQSGAGNGTATLVSVEKVIGTNGVDIFEVTQLLSAQLAGSDGKGGLAEVDLRGEDKPSLEGDLIDATKMTEKLVIDLNPTAGFIQVEGDAERKVNVLNAERAWGGEKDDSITGNDQANELKGGAGDDILSGGNGNDVFYGERGNDQIWGGALNASASASDGIDEARYDFGVTIRLSTTAVSELMVDGGSYGMDTLHSIERITGSSGGDRIWIEGLPSNVLNGLEWIDLGANPSAMHDGIDAGYLNDALRIDLGAGRFALKSDPSVGFNFRNVEDADGGKGDDVIIGDDGANGLSGGLGNNEVYGGAGDDTIGTSGLGHDKLWGGTGNDQFNVYNGDTIYDIDAGDRVFFNGGFLTGGAAIGPDEYGRERYYTAPDATIYYWAPGSTTLQVDGLMAGSLLILDFQNGDGGIFLGGGTFGTGGNDSLSGGSQADTLSGLDGDDTLTGGAGDDTLDGGNGNDTFLVGAGSGLDVIFGGYGTDTVAATADSTVIGLRGMTGVEIVTADGHADVSVRTSDLDDHYDFGGVTFVGITQIDAAAGNDILIGNAQANVMLGGSGDDTLDGAGGNDTLSGGDGNDIFLVGPGGGFDAFDGGAGSDTIEASADSVVIGLSSVGNVETISANGFSNVSIQTTDADESWDFYDTNLVGISEINVGGGNDYLVGHSLMTILRGGDGDDEIYSQEGNDTLYGDAGNDYLSGWYGDDTYYGGTGDDFYEDFSGDDTYHYNIGDGTDIIDEWEGFDVLVLGPGIAPGDVTVSIDNDDVIFSFAGGGEVIVWYGAYEEYAVDEVHFADDTVWTFADMMSGANGPQQGMALWTDGIGPEENGMALAMAGPRPGAFDSMADSVGVGHWGSDLALTALGSDYLTGIPHALA
jgi:Ca2+-binding RTX toxin-like protein